MCLYSSIRPNKKYRETKKNGGIIPAVQDERTLYVAYGCGECMECRKQKAREWQIRMTEDIKTNTNGKFITLTFSNKELKKIHDYTQEKIENAIDKLRHLPQFNDESIKKINKLKSLQSGYNLDNEIATQATHLWRENWRKEYKKSPRHWLITELGHEGTENIHLHGIIWTDYDFQTIADKWKYGFIWPRPDNKKECKKNYVSPRTINYIIKYVVKHDTDHYGWKSKILTSPGIGRNYTDSHNATYNKYNEMAPTQEWYRTKTGHKMGMPTYWRNKIYSEEEREKLWIQKLDKQERWVGGERVDISKGMDEYYKLLEWYRKRNQELGFGTGEKNWTRQQYEEERRAIRLYERIQPAALTAQQRI